MTDNYTAYDDWEDDESGYDNSESFDLEDICACGRRATDECGFCGEPLCFMCFECGAGFCHGPHTDEQIQDYARQVYGMRF